MKTNTKMTVTLLKQNAELIYELLCNAGWMDDADDLLAYIVEEEGKGAAEQKMAEVNDLINLINPLLDNPLDKIDEDLDTY
jgi:hypothetical protein